VNATFLLAIVFAITIKRLMGANQLAE